MNKDNSVTDKYLFSWIEKSVENEKLRNYEFTVTGNTEKGDGYIGDIIFVRVNGTTLEDKGKTLHLVIKHGKSNEQVRKTLPLRAAFHTEIHVYNEIFPTFKQALIEKNIPNIFISVPKCYKTFILNNMEALVLENLKPCGFNLYNRKETFNMHHLKAVLKEYGKLHALSFALRDQKMEEFNNLSAFKSDAFRELIATELFRRSFKKSIANTLNILQEKNELYLMEKLNHFVTKDAADMILDLLAQYEPQSVVIHGDCWNNNFMFKYQNNDTAAPVNVAILDWQMAALRSPVFDLSFLIYCTGSKNELDKFEELITEYYDSFAKFLNKLGSDPEKLFPYSALQSHWRKYSSFGLLLMTVALPMVLCDKEQAPAFETLEEGDIFGDMHSLSTEDKELCYSRMKAVIHHYFEYKF